MLARAPISGFSAEVCRCSRPLAVEDSICHSPSCHAAGAGAAARRNAATTTLNFCTVFLDERLESGCIADGIPDGLELKKRHRHVTRARQQVVEGGDGFVDFAAQRVNLRDSGQNLW